MPFEKKDFKFSVASVDEEAGTFEGYASVFDAVDSWGDAVDKGAFKKTIKEHKGVFPLLWYHNVTEPIGIITVSEDDHGLKAAGELNLDVQRGKEVYSLLKQKALKGLSIGFETIKERIVEEVRRLQEIGLWEISLLVFQACPGATVSDVKSAALQADIIEMLETLGTKRRLTNREQRFVGSAVKLLAPLATEADLEAILPLGTTADDVKVIGDDPKPEDKSAEPPKGTQNTARIDPALLKSITDDLTYMKDKI